jgi:hypothetical protein
LDFDYMLDDPDGNDGWYGQAQAADGNFIHEVGELERDDSQENWQDDPDTDRWYAPAQEAGPEPVVPRQYYPQPRQSAPEQSDKPEIGVTRTPVTRAPISATPPPPPKPDNNSATPGDAPGAPKRGWGW